MISVLAPFLSSFRPSNLMEETRPLPWKSSLSEGVCVGERSGLSEGGWGTRDYVEALFLPIWGCLPDGERVTPHSRERESLVGPRVGDLPQKCSESLEDRGGRETEVLPHLAWGWLGSLPRTAGPHLASRHPLLAP